MGSAAEQDIGSRYLQKSRVEAFHSANVPKRKGVFGMSEAVIGFSLGRKHPYLILPDVAKPWRL